MHRQPTCQVAIVDYGLGNLYSVQRGCERVGLDAAITSSRSDVMAADAVILPGVGAFGDAMANLDQLDLVGPLRQFACTGKPLIGICLGLQLLMDQSEEFGSHRGLGIIAGQVVHFGAPREGDRTLKVPQVGWNRVYPPSASGADNAQSWSGSPMEGVPVGQPFYFVHSYYVKPASSDDVLTTSRYGDIEFCSAIRRGNVCAFQYHPERSGPWGIHVYQNLARHIAGNRLQHAKERQHAA